MPKGNPKNGTFQVMLMDSKKKVKRLYTVTYQNGKIVKKVLTSKKSTAQISEAEKQKMVEEIAKNLTENFNKIMNTKEEIFNKMIDSYQDNPSPENQKKIIDEMDDTVKRLKTAGFEIPDDQYKEMLQPILSEIPVGEYSLKYPDVNLGVYQTQYFTDERALKRYYEKLTVEQKLNSIPWDTINEHRLWD